MSDLSAERASTSRSSAPVRLIAAAAAILLVLGATAFYFRVGWWRMESACSLDDAHGQTHDSVTYDWSWHPLGFQCAYGNGETHTSLWF